MWWATLALCHRDYLISAVHIAIMKTPLVIKIVIIACVFGRAIGGDVVTAVSSVEVAASYTTEVIKENGTTETPLSTVTVEYADVEVIKVLPTVQSDNVGEEDETLVTTIASVPSIDSETQQEVTTGEIIPDTAALPSNVTGTNVTEQPKQTITDVPVPNIETNISTTVPELSTQKKSPIENIPSTASSTEIQNSSVVVPVTTSAKTSHGSNPSTVVLVSTPSTDIRVNNFSSNVPFGDATTEVPVHTSTVVVPVITSSTDLPVSTQSTIIPVRVASTNVTVNTSTVVVSIITSSKAVPVKTQSTAVPSTDSTTDVPVNTSTVDVSVITSYKAVPVKTQSTDVPSTDSTTDVPVNTSTVVVSVITSFKAVPVKTQSTDVPSTDSTTDVPVNTSTLVVPVTTSSKTVPVKTQSTAVPSTDSTSDVPVNTSLETSGHQSEETTTVSTKTYVNTTTTSKAPSDNPDDLEKEQVTWDSTETHGIMSTTETTSTNASDLETTTLNEEPVTLGSTHASCNTTADCSKDDICSVLDETCVCVSDENGNSNITPCQSEYKAGDVSTHVVASTIGGDVGNVSREQTSFRRQSNLSEHDRDFCVVSVKLWPQVEIVEWFQSYDYEFRLFIATEMSKGVKSKNGNNLTFTPQHIIYVGPSPLQEENVIVLSFVVQNASITTHDDFLSYKEVDASLKKMQKALETQLNISVCGVVQGLPDKWRTAGSDHLLPGLTTPQARLVFVALLAVSVFATFVAVVAVILKCRQARSVIFQHQVNLPYRFPRVVARSPGDGHNLASDEQCQLGEDGVKLEENGSCTLLADANVWVVPYEGYTKKDSLTGDVDNHGEDLPVNVEDTKV